MERHDPLSSLSPTGGPPLGAAPVPSPAPEPAPATDRKVRKPRKAKATPLLKSLATLQDSTIAFLYAGPNGNAEDVAPSVPTIRKHFTWFCEANPNYTDWRQAWPSFMAQTSMKCAKGGPLWPRNMDGTLCAPDFVAEIEAAGARVGKTPHQMYAMWHKYEEDSRTSDQSAILSEFLQWHLEELTPVDAPPLGGIIPVDFSARAKARAKAILVPPVQTKPVVTHAAVADRQVPRWRERLRAAARLNP
jgi:hypothetical protein